LLFLLLSRQPRPPSDRCACHWRVWQSTYNPHAIHLCTHHYHQQFHFQSWLRWIASGRLLLFNLSYSWQICLLYPLPLSLSYSESCLPFGHALKPLR